MRLKELKIRMLYMRLASLEDLNNMSVYWFRERVGVEDI